MIDNGSTRLTMTALPGRHAPTPVDRLLPPVIGTMLEFGPVQSTSYRRVYVSGDTFLVDELQDIPVRFQSIDAGNSPSRGDQTPGRQPVAFWPDGDDGRSPGRDAVQMLEPPRVIPVHFDDYRLSPGRFTNEIANRGLGERIVEIERGQTVAI